jgi:hypothetical protein
MLRELPDTELPDHSDYERWYFEVQRAAREGEGRERHGEGAGGNLPAHRPSQRGTKRERRYSIPPQERGMTLLP